MRNLKKIVSSAIVLVMVFSLLCINAYAYDANDLTNSAYAHYASSTIGGAANHASDNDYTLFVADPASGGWWHSNAGQSQWIAIDFGATNSKKISKLNLLSGAPGYGGNLKDFKLQASNDSTNGENGTWVDIYSKTNNTDQVNTWQTFEFNAPSTAYRFYRIYVTATWNYNYVIITEWEMMESQIQTPNAPTNLTAVGSNSKVDLSWTASTGATSYNIKRSLSASGQFTTIGTSTTTNYTDTTVTNDTTYYYVVTAVNSGGESPNSNVISVTPTNKGNRAILVITMTNGIVKEYDMSAAEIDAFLNWYDNKENGVAGTKSYFPIKKNYNVKPFLNRIDYIIFSKIQDFEIKDYNA
ncbi:MAG: discoidin domain-containing protein [Clostridia bacterium]|nr:discoidin domain-containing protein [Clostridia bacterium]